MCGIAFVRLRKPLQYFIDQYQNPMYGIQKLYLLMEKQHNRGQDGAGALSIKLDVPPGFKYISRERSVQSQPIADIFNKIYHPLNSIHSEGIFEAEYLKKKYRFLSEVLMGHLRYGTHGLNAIDNCHPMIRQNNWKSRTLVLAGNFNMTNNTDLFDELVNFGQHPREAVDTVTVLEKIGFFLDEANQAIFDRYKNSLNRIDISKMIEEKIDLKEVLSNSCKSFDGGYAMVGITGYGASFIVRDPSGIRPAYFYADDEILVAASEKTAIKTALNIDYDTIQEVKPGHALIVDQKGYFKQEQISSPKEKKSCSFERIYFSRGTDPEIYKERKELGNLLCKQVLEAVDHDLEHTIFSYIPNTAETAFLGLMKGLENYLEQKRLILSNQSHKEKEFVKQLSIRPRVEKLVVKDAKLRTFIANDSERNELVKHVYDTTYGVVNQHMDTIVLIDDSIVRGTTLEKSILQMADRLQPKRIVIVSSAPQIRYPDCYGIDMSKMSEFIAFRAAIKLLKDKNKEKIIDEVYQLCKIALQKGDHSQNYVKMIYQDFTAQEISTCIEAMVSKEIRAEVKIIYQSIENLHDACPNHLGDWYFTGNYPTSGGIKVVNQSFVNMIEGKSERAY